MIASTLARSAVNGRPVALSLWITLLSLLTARLGFSSPSLTASLRRGRRALWGVRSVDVYPVEGAFYGLFPGGVRGVALVLGPLGGPAGGLVPVGPEFVGVAPEVDGEAGGVGGAQGGGLGHHGAADGDAEDVGLDLHAQVVGGDAAVDLEDVQLDAGVGGHRLGDVAGLVADGFQGGAGQVRVGVVAGQADDGAARVGTPVR